MASIVVLPAEELEALVERAARRALGAGVTAGLIDKQQLAQKLGCSATHIDVLRRQGMPWIPVGNAVRFELDAVLGWLRQQKGESEAGK